MTQKENPNKTKRTKTDGRTLMADARREKKRPTHQRKTRRRVLFGLPVVAGILAIVVIIVRSLRPVTIPYPSTQPASVRSAPQGRSSR